MRRWPTWAALWRASEIQPRLPKSRLNVRTRPFADCELRGRHVAASLAEQNNRPDGYDWNEIGEKTSEQQRPLTVLVFFPGGWVALDGGDPQRHDADYGSR
jgi:hypothetical protein